MKQERTKKKVNGLLIFSVCLLIVAIVTPLTFALFTDYKTSTTNITFGKIQIDAGKTRVDTNIANLLPSSAVFDDKVVVAKDVFSESYILRASQSFSTESEVEGIDAYTSALSGTAFNKKDAYGNFLYEDNGYYDVDSETLQAAIDAAVEALGADPTDEAVETATNGVLAAHTLKVMTSPEIVSYAVADATNEAYDTLAEMNAIRGADNLGYYNAGVWTALNADITQDNLCIADNKWYKETTYENVLYVKSTTAAVFADATTENVVSVGNVAQTTLYNHAGNATVAANSAYRYGDPIQANGFILQTQAVDSEGNIYVSTFDGTNYTLEDTGEDVAANSGYATNYRWYFDATDNHYYLCNFFADDAAASATIKVVERTQDNTLTNASYDDQTFNLTTKAGRDALVYHAEHVKTVTVGAVTHTLAWFEGDVRAKKSAYISATASLEDAQDDYADAVTATNGSKTGLATYQGDALAAIDLIENAAAKAAALANYNIVNNALIAYLNSNDTSATNPMGANSGSVYDAKTALNALGGDIATYVTQAGTTAGLKETELAALADVNTASAGVTTAKGNLDDSLANYSEARDLIAASLKDFQELYVFALGGEDYNTIPEDLTQLAEYAQYGIDFTLSLQFDAVQAANLPIDITDDLEDILDTDGDDFRALFG